MITHQVFVPPSAVAVAISEEQLVLCHEVLGQAGLEVHSAPHVLTACERITRLLPQVVVTSSTLRHDVREMIEDRAVAVGAVLVELHPSRPYDAIERSLGDAVATARTRLGRRPRSS